MKKIYPSPWIKILKTVYGNSFKINGSQDILNFCDFTVSKIVLHNKIVSEMQTKKDEENSVHLFGDNNLTNHIAIFLQDWIKPSTVGALRVSTSYQFWEKNC